MLDRCADPHQIMKDIYDALDPKGRVIVALVLPYSHYVETSKNIHLFYRFRCHDNRTFSDSSHLPIKPLLPHWPERSIPFEEEATVFFEQLELMGFNIEVRFLSPLKRFKVYRETFFFNSLGPRPHTSARVI